MTFRKFSALAALAFGLCTAGAAHAMLVATGSGEVTATDNSQLGRVFRNGVASTWAAPKAFPGTTSTGTTFFYDEVNVSFAANAGQQVFYEISWLNLDATSPHLVAYVDDYLPGALGTNYLGDFGATPVAGAGTRTFQVAVAAGHQLVLAFSSTGSLGRYEYSVNAFSDANRAENFGQLPEPTSLALVGIAALALGMSRRRKPA